MNDDSKPNFSKTDARFWFDRLFKRGDSKDWNVQIGFAGHQERFPLKTPNKETAAVKAREIYLSLHSIGWDETRAKFKPWQNQVQKITSPTVGEFLAAIEKHALGFVKETHIKPIVFTSYSRKFRRLVSGIMEIKGDASRFHRGEGSAKWRKLVDAVRLSDLTAEKIISWRNKFVSSQVGNPQKKERAARTAQSILRNSKSLFSQKVLARLSGANVQLDLPKPLPFAEVKIGNAPKNTYTSSLNPEELARTANKELPKLDTELFKIFLLAFGVGLRRGEIDRLTWPQFNWSKAQINVVVTAHGDTKTESSVAAVDVDPVLMKLFKKFKSQASGEFVIESTVQPRPGANWHHYRCNCAFMRLNDWLRAQGVDTPNPIHTLRKEFGTLICQKFGIFAASEALRHSDIRLTRAHYVDRRGRIHLEVGKMLSGKT